MILEEDSHVPENLLIEYPYETYITCVQINMHSIEDRPQFLRKIRPIDSYNLETRSFIAQRAEQE